MTLLASFLCVVLLVTPENLLFQVAKRREKLLNYMLFLRVTPTLPNTFINVASPIVGVPYHIFFLATFIGLIPAAYVTVRVLFTTWNLILMLSLVCANHQEFLFSGAGWTCSWRAKITWWPLWFPVCGYAFLYRHCYCHTDTDKQEPEQGCGLKEFW